MTVRVATVLSARDWEPNLVAYARDHAAVRIVVRAYQPKDVDRYLDDVDVVVAGGEVSWVTPSCVEEWRRAGAAVIGVAPAGDGPAGRLLLDSGADEVVPDTIDTAALVQAIRFVAPVHRATRDEGRGRVTAVLGPRGAPGVTEVAISHALTVSRHAETVLVDADIDAPSIAVRLGLPPRPDLTDVADAARSSGTLGSDLVHRYGSLDVVTGSHRSAEPLLRPELIESAFRSLRSRWDEVIVDLGSTERSRVHIAQADDAILVVEGSAIGIVRGAQLVADWVGPTPALILNRVEGGSQGQMVEAAQRWMGLDPILVVFDRRAVRRASTRAMRPDRRFAKAIGAIGRVP